MFVVAVKGQQHGKKWPLRSAGSDVAEVYRVVIICLLSTGGAALAAAIASAESGCILSAVVNSIAAYHYYLIKCERSKHAACGAKAGNESVTRLRYWDWLCNGLPPLPAPCCVHIRQTRVLSCNSHPSPDDGPRARVGQETR